MLGRALFLRHNLGECLVRVHEAEAALAEFNGVAIELASYPMGGFNVNPLIRLIEEETSSFDSLRCPNSRPHTFGSC